MDYEPAAGRPGFANPPVFLLSFATPGAQDAGALNHPKEGA